MVTWEMKIKIKIKIDTGVIGKKSIKVCQSLLTEIAENQVKERIEGGIIKR